MLDRCKKVSVLGAGTMGGGIAAHLANLGFQVDLYDLTQESVTSAFERTQKARPPHFFTKDKIGNITLKSITNDLAALADSDWVCEAIIEKMDAKKALYEQIEPIIRPDALISTNTSGLELNLLKEGRSDDFRRRFLGTHFFNPPRYLKLLELIPTDETDPVIISATTQFLEDQVARRVVLAKDTPGFIANRFGMWSMFYNIHIAEKLQMSVEEVDAICGPFIGRPRTGAFRLSDLVGLDIMQDIASNLIERCPHDKGTAHLTKPSSLDFLLDKGWIGSKVKQGYYRKESDQLVAFDLTTHAYRELQTPQLALLNEHGRKPLAERLQAGIDSKCEVGEFLREYLIPTLQYADSIKEEISHNVQDFDRVMKWGFGWEAGPFEMADMIGHEKLGLEPKKYYQGSEFLAFDGNYQSPLPEPNFATIHDFPTLKDLESVRLVDLGDGVKTISIKSKMGVISHQVVNDMTSLIDSGEFTGGVITSESKVYSVGFDLRFLNEMSHIGDYDAIDQSIKNFQELNLKLKKLPTIAAIWGFCLGGGLEIAMGCSQVVALAETQIGLPESLVGLNPAGCGVAVMRTRTQFSTQEMVSATKRIAQGALASNADEAKEWGYLTDADVIEYHPDRLLMTAKKLVHSVKVSNHPEWKAVSGPYVGMVEKFNEELIATGQYSNHDKHINDKVRHIFAKATSFEEAVEMERSAFVNLCKEGLTQARLKHMVETNKPLRN